MPRKTPADPTQTHRHAAIRRRVRDEFDRWATSYDRSWLNELVFFPTVRICQEEILRWQMLRGGGPFRLLDIGCGTGTFASLMASWPDAERVVGLDYSPVMVRQFAEKIGGSPQAARVHVVQGDSERLPFADDSFDVLTCGHSFHHYPHQAAVIRDFRRVLRPGGVLILVDGFRDNVVGWVVFDVGVALIERDVHHASWTELRDMIHGAGFATLRQRKLNVLAPLLVNVAGR
jgi:ubiquinone/menaquinone biosynthesis C-methylase UbiE